MAFYEKAKPVKMTKQDHLRADAKREEEGTRYKKAGRFSAEDDRRGRSGSSFSGHYGEHKNSFSDHGYRKGPANGFGKDHSFQEEKRGYGSPSSRPGPRPDFRKDDPLHEKPRQNALPNREYRPAPVKPLPPAFDPSPKEARHTAPEALPLPENLLSGRNPIREALKAGRDIEKLLVAKGELSGSAREIVAEAKERHIPVQIVERTRLDEITRNHQGMLAFASAYRYSEVEDMLEEAREKGEAPFLIVLDGITDPMNLGAIIRTAACVGAHGVIVPERRAAGLTPTAVKASAGAIEVVKVARVTNLNRTLDMLRHEGIWLYAADMKGEDFRKVDFTGPAALIIGGEGEGVSRLTLDKCDRIVSIPMSGKLDSLNASVAAGVLMYAVMSGR